MRGHLKNRNGNYTIVIYHGKDPITGEKKYTWHSCNQLLGRKASKPEAELLLNEMVRQVADDKFVKPEKITFQEFLLKHWLPHIKTTVRHSTYTRYAGIVKNHLVPQLGGLQLSKIKPVALQKLYRDLLQEGSRKDKRTGGLSPRSVQYVHATAHKALSQAMVWQMIAANPAEAVELPKMEKKQMSVWDAVQVKKFLDGTKGHRLHSLYYVAFTTGMRKSEILGLKWVDVDLQKGIIAVRQGSHYQENEFQYQEPKSKKSKRTITLPPETVKALEDHKHWQKQKYMAAKNKKPFEDHPDLVFRSSRNTPIFTWNLTRHFDQTIETLKLPRITFHEIRHTHATLLLQSGEHVKVVSERLGHASVAITMDLYSHVLPNMQQGAADKIQNLLFSD